MSDSPNYARTAAERHLVDTAYLAWLDAEVECEDALRAWLHGPADDRAGLYASYHAALDREEAAAGELARRCRPRGVEEREAAVAAA